MARCMFLGFFRQSPRVADDKLRAAIAQVIQENETVEFLFYQQPFQVPFYDLCLMETMRAKRQSEKRVTITLLVDSRRYDDFMRRDMAYPPLDLIDQVRPIQVPETTWRDHSKGYKHVMREMIKQSDHVISGIYEDVFCVERNFLLYARRSPARQVIDVTDEEIARLILERAAALPERERIIFHMIRNGATLKEVAERVGVSANRVQQISHKMGHTLRKYAEDTANAPPVARKTNEE